RAEIDHVGAGNPCSVIEIRIENLRCKTLPSTGGSAVDGARPALADSAIVLLDVGDQLPRDGIAVGPDVRGIYGIRIVEVRCRVLDCDQDESRKTARGPVLIELVSVLRCAEFSAFEIFARRGSTEA